MDSGLATTQQTTVLSRREVQALDFTAAQRQLIRDAYAKGASDEEFAVLMEIARVRSLNPLLRQVFFVSRWDSKLNRETWQTQVAIDGLRAIAERTGLYAGQDEPEFEENPDGSVKCCRVRVWRKDWTRPAVGVAYFEEYVQTTTDRATRKTAPAKFWRQMPHNMIAKCAESLALRKAFPEDTAGLYTPEEMGQADNDAPPRRGRAQLESAPEARQLPEGHPATTPEVDGTEPEDIAAPTCADLAGLRAWYVGLGLGADDSRAADEASGLAGDHISALGYLLNSVEHRAALGGTLDADLATLHDALAMERTADGVVRVARTFGGLGASADARKVMCRYYAPRVGLTGKPAADALRAALTPAPQPPPTGTDAPRSSAGPASAEGAPVAATPTAGAEAREQRTELEPDEVAARILRADASGDAAWRAHCATTAAEKLAAGKCPRNALAEGYAKRRFLFTQAGGTKLASAREAATVDEMVQHGGDREWNIALIASKCTRSPALGTVHKLPTREQRAQRTGTDG